MTYHMGMSVYSREHAANSSDLLKFCAAFSPSVQSGSSAQPQQTPSASFGGASLASSLLEPATRYDAMPMLPWNPRTLRPAPARPAAASLQGGSPLLQRSPHRTDPEAPEKFSSSSRASRQARTSATNVPGRAPSASAHLRARLSGSKRQWTRHRASPNHH